MWYKLIRFDTGQSRRFQAMVWRGIGCQIQTRIWCELVSDVVSSNPIECEASQTVSATIQDGIGCQIQPMLWRKLVSDVVSGNTIQSEAIQSGLGYGLAWYRMLDLAYAQAVRWYLIWCELIRLDTGHSRAVLARIWQDLVSGFWQVFVLLGTCENVYISYPPGGDIHQMPIINCSPIQDSKQRANSVKA